MAINVKAEDGYKDQSIILSQNKCIDLINFNKIRMNYMV